MLHSETLKQRYVQRTKSSVSVIPSNEKQALMKEFSLSEAEICFSLLPIAATLAHVPLSNFHVGAIAKGSSGALYFGANIEFESAPLGHTIHAEQAACNNAWMNGENGIEDIFVTAPPCGHCRQFMNELNTSHKLNIWIKDSTVKTLKSLLPDDFGPTDLGIEASFLTNNSQSIAALERSYSPYTQSPSAVELLMKNGTIYHGAYAENAAFNPSLPPLQSALIMCILDRCSLNDIVRVTLKESPSNRIKHRDTSASLASLIAPQAEFVVA
ncbi:cytidine deaminase [Vibrio viridaestus]|uniref:Cytidine deaminase n=1 Tax=Vibrio viridaestus TaxID=2487322 RepID=A0A3N9TYC2_9VIBR|nr:cytidine deaminase [Vibrio viridaestus]RQW61932.1 cytidine deaminase [Vibrio viridaestus]